VWVCVWVCCRIGVRAQTCATFCIAKELPMPNEVLTAVAFAALDTVSGSLTSYTGLVNGIRQVLLHAVYTDVPAILEDSLPALADVRWLWVQLHGCALRSALLALTTLCCSGW